MRRYGKLRIPSLCLHRRFAIEHTELPFQGLNLGLYLVHRFQRRPGLVRAGEKDCGFVEGLARHSADLVVDRMMVWGVVDMTVAVGRPHWNTRHEILQSRKEVPAQLRLLGTGCGRTDCW